jgi:hypothetical protein
VKPETKLAIRRWTIRKLRLLLDFLDDRLHAAEVRLRDELSIPVRVESPRTSRSERQAVSSVGSVEADEFLCDRVRGRISSGDQPLRAAQGESFEQWEMRRSGIRTSLRIAGESGIASDAKKSEPEEETRASQQLTGRSHKSARRRGMPARAFDLRFVSR